MNCALFPKKWYSKEQFLLLQAEKYQYQYLQQFIKEVKIVSEFVKYEREVKDQHKQKILTCF